MIPPGSRLSDRERDLRAELRASSGRRVLTGGQTGVDTVAAISALRAGLDVHLVFPRGFRQEDGPLTAARRRALAGATLHELASPEFSYRTWTCAYLSDAVILVDPAGGDGCQETIRAADRLARPLLNLPAGRGQLVGQATIERWLKQTDARVLMIAGCRESLLVSQGMTGDVDAQVDLILSGMAATFGWA